MAEKDSEDIRFVDAKGHPVCPGMTSWQPTELYLRAPCVGAGIKCSECEAKDACGELAFEVGE